MEQDVSDREIPSVIGALITLAGWGGSLPAPPHPLAGWFAEYGRWRSVGAPPDDIPENVRHLADYALGVDRFEEDWNDPDTRSWLGKRLRDPGTCLGYLWEFKVAVNSAIRGFEVHWTGAQKGMPDVHVKCSTGEEVWIECVRRMTTLDNIDSEDQLAALLARYMRKKAKQRAGINAALEVVLFLPVLYTFQRDSVFKTVGDTVRECFVRTGSEPQCACVSGFRVITFRPPEVVRRADGRTVQDMSLSSAFFPNQNADYLFPAEYWRPKVGS